jgi:hypothetical protein
MKPSKINTTYMVALSIIALILIGSHLSVRRELSSQESDAAVINLAGRQRMLSQKIVKMALELSQEGVGYSTSEKLNKTVEEFVKSHQNLTKQSNELNLTHENSDLVANMYANLYPKFEKIKSSIAVLLDKRDVPQNEVNRKAGLNTLISSANAFLPEMNSIVKQYEKESKAKLDRLLSLETILLAIALGILLLEALIIFRPMVRQIRKDRQAILQKNRELLEGNEELRQLTEEILAQRDSLERQHNHIKASQVKIEGSINYAKRIQDAILPSRKRLKEYIGNIGIYYRAKDKVSGDF